MPTFKPEYIKKRTIVTKEGDPSYRLDCPTFGEAATAVDPWPSIEKRRARFRVEGEIFTWDELAEQGAVNPIEDAA